MPGAEGLCARFASRREADLAVEHLVQEHSIDRNVIFVEPAGGTSSTGTQIAGADRASAPPGTGERNDAPLRGEIQLTVAVTDDDRQAAEKALREAGARQVRSIS